MLVAPWPELPGLGSRVRLYRASTLKESATWASGTPWPHWRGRRTGGASRWAARAAGSRSTTSAAASWSCRRTRPRARGLPWTGAATSSRAARRTGASRADVRVSPRSCVARWKAHRQEVCGLRWSPGGDALATGGNDNAGQSLVCVEAPGAGARELQGHGAAVKALAWSPITAAASRQVNAAKSSARRPLNFCNLGRDTF